jgi:hypothetical protein
MLWTKKKSFSKSEVIPSNTTALITDSVKLKDFFPAKFRNSGFPESLEINTKKELGIKPTRAEPLYVAGDLSHKLKTQNMKIVKSNLYRLLKSDIMKPFTSNGISQSFIWPKKLTVHSYNK